MIILTIRTDSPDAEIGIYTPDHKQLSYITWRADRQLAKDLLGVMKQQLDDQKKSWADIGGIVIFQGPGSFTGLRIGITVANSLAYGQQIPIVAEKGEHWLRDGLARLQKNQDDKLVVPFYGAEARITRPKK